MKKVTKWTSVCEAIQLQISHLLYYYLIFIDTRICNRISILKLINSIESYPISKQILDYA